jgi:hypothetical protein
MKNVSTGFGLCIVGLGIAVWPVLDRLVPQASAAIVADAAALSQPQNGRRSKAAPEQSAPASDSVDVVETMVSSVTASNQEVVFVVQAMSDGSCRVGRLWYSAAPAPTDYRRLNTEVPSKPGFGFSGWTAFR